MPKAYRELSRASDSGHSIARPAAGGISTVEDMETFLALGADRLGTSRAVKILNGEQAKGY